MLEIILLGIFTVFLVFFIVLWVESIFLHDDEFSAVKEWQTFQTTMKGKK